MLHLRRVVDAAVTIVAVHLTMLHNAYSLAHSFIEWVTLVLFCSVLLLVFAELS